jgi:KDO2-lipid IV(A) lauroyltransferase
VWGVKVLPAWLSAAVSYGLTEIYWWTARHRCEVVVRNLMPVCGEDRRLASAAAKRLFRNFGTKLIDLWRYEGGMPVQHFLGESSGWEHYEAAKREGRGVLLLTPHLGNWELGGPWLTGRGIQLHVITLDEPGEEFTRFREAARARWNIRTLVVGSDPFGVLEIIRLLDGGATVALLVDRPIGNTKVEASLFGRPLMVSVAAAELARASGCSLLPVYVPRVGQTYAAHILPPIAYDRAALRQWEARKALSQEIMNAFEPILRRYPDQWYNFVPVWQEPAEATNLNHGVEHR